MSTMVLQKMAFENRGTEHRVVPSYFLRGNTSVRMNDLIGKRVSLKFSGRIYCIACGKSIKKTYGQGFCYPCFISVPETEECVFRPELCRAHEGIARDMEYATQNCLIRHVVYIANSGGVKVGITRYHQVPTRWVDQGASAAIQVLFTANRYLSGVIEVALKKVFADKTNWRKMLAGKEEQADLPSLKSQALEFVQQSGAEYTQAPNTIYTIEYPVAQYPSKVSSLSFDKTPEIVGVLRGIRGQYLLFEGGSVVNIRKHSGYELIISSEE